MFKKNFSYFGRIGRSEYGYSFIACYFALGVAYTTFKPTERVSTDSITDIACFIVHVIIIWFGLTQAIKRCHDRDHPGWYLLVPMYYIWLLFADSKPYPNKYGPDPKGRDISLPVLN